MKSCCFLELHLSLVQFFRQSFDFESRGRLKRGESLVNKDDGREGEREGDRGYLSPLTYPLPLALWIRRVPQHSGQHSDL